MLGNKFGATELSINNFGEVVNGLGGLQLLFYYLSKYWITPR